MKFLFEVAATPIYQRIIEGFSAALRRLGHEVWHINYAKFTHLGDYLKVVQESGVDYCVVTNSVAPLSQYVKNDGKFLFEFLKSKTIFIHHDGICGDLLTFEAIRERLAAFVRIKDRSCHFCIEDYNCTDLEALGLDSVYKLYHASEFVNEQRDVRSKYNVSFIGHVLPSAGCFSFPDPSLSHYQNADFWGRIVRQDREIEPSAIEYAGRKLPDKAFELDWIAEKYSYIAKLHIASQPYRGGIIERLREMEIDIFGGDPGYLHGLPAEKMVEKAGLTYHPPTSDYLQASAIFAASRINLNITSLQFDHAVINRVIDIASCGGFLLTDWKSDLRKLTAVHDEISYRTVDELNEKIDYYLTHERERVEIAGQLHQDISAKCSYTAIVNYILGKVDSGISNDSQRCSTDLRV